MRRARWLADWRGTGEKPVFYHCISRVVERRFAFGPEEKEKFRTFMRMQEKFTGCRVVAYCVMCNHFHLLLEVPTVPEGGITDEVLLERLSAIYTEAFIAAVAKELAEAKALGNEGYLAEIRWRFTYRMNDLGEFMKGLLQRFTQWFNRVHSRTGRLWEDRFKSVIVEDGIAAKTMAAYIDLNPIRAKMVKDPADYRWSSYGEAMGGGETGAGKTAQAGLVRALCAHFGQGADWQLWAKGISRDYRKLLMTGAIEKTVEQVGRDGQRSRKTIRKGISNAEAGKSDAQDGEVSLGKMLYYRIRYFSDGAVIGSRLFVNEAFAQARSRFGKKRQSGARRMNGPAGALSGELWSCRDLRKGVVS